MDGSTDLLFRFYPHAARVRPTYRKTRGPDGPFDGDMNGVLVFVTSGRIASSTEFGTAGSQRSVLAAQRSPDHAIGSNDAPLSLIVATVGGARVAETVVSDNAAGLRSRFPEHRVVHFGDTPHNGVRESGS
ncbi:hypothetical protein EAH80_19045 [Mycobacterium hodleri]|uniref:Uncharacterized protein n=1 Tax=Mycolicibacterium hodleri TaxID=49897 RepID=A0A502E4W7_9MYCO|nr:hypothetical protein EAH80_19045 [Mycolicibacterium hodleri]